MSISFQSQHDYIERRASFRPASTIRCPSCSSVHVEQGEHIDSGEVSFLWRDPHQTYAVYAYSCQACGAEFVTGTTEHYHRQHPEAGAVTLH